MVTANATLCTAMSPGAIGIIQLHGEGAVGLVEQLTGVTDWPVGRARLVRFAEIDRGLAVRICDASHDSGHNMTTCPDMFQLMPHSGPRVVRDLLDRLAEMGASFTPVTTRTLYPEAATDLEADMLSVLTTAASEAAVERLLAQPEMWRRWLTNADWSRIDAIMSDSDVLDRLVHPATVVVVGPPNVGKSTLTNRLAGRTASVVADLPGTTRDWVGSLVELRGHQDEQSPICGGIAVRWLDTPGIHVTDDEVETEAINLAQEVISDADVLIGMRDPCTQWLTHYPSGRTPDILATNKIDTDQSLNDRHPAAINMSAKTGEGLATLEQAIIRQLRLDDMLGDLPWTFSPRLRELIACKDEPELRLYAGG